MHVEHGHFTDKNYSELIKETKLAIKCANKDFDWEMLILKRSMRYDWTAGGRELNLINIFNFIEKMILEKNPSEFLSSRK